MARRFKLSTLWRAFAALSLLTACGTAHASYHLTGHTRIVSAPWQLIKVHGRDIKIFFSGGGCDRFDRIKTTQTLRSVTIAVYEFDYVPGPGEACAANAWGERRVVHLRRPLDHRKLVHAPATPAFYR